MFKFGRKREKFYFVADIGSEVLKTIILKANRSEVTVNNKLVTQNSLIYITPTGDTQAQSLYLLRQVPEKLTLPGSEGSFTVGISQPIPIDLKFNFLIIN